MENLIIFTPLPPGGVEDLVEVEGYVYRLANLGTLHNEVEQSNRILKAGIGTKIRFCDGDRRGRRATLVRDGKAVSSADKGHALHVSLRGIGDAIVVEVAIALALFHEVRVAISVAVLFQGISFDLVAIHDAITVGVGPERIGAAFDLNKIGHSIAVGVGHRRIGTVVVFFVPAKAIAVDVVVGCV